MKKLKKVKVREFGVYDLSGKLTDLISTLQEIRDTYPGHDLEIEFDIDTNWDYPSGSVRIHYWREESESEYLERCEKAAKQAAVDELAERKEFERLKAKFEGGEK